MDIDRNVSESDSSAGLVDVVEKFDSTVDELYALASSSSIVHSGCPLILSKTDSAIHPAPFKAAVLTCMG